MLVSSLSSAAPLPPPPGNRPGETPESVLLRHFGFPAFRAGQRELVQAVVEGTDALGILPTGGGKSICYQVPAVLLGGLTLVVTPAALMVFTRKNRDPNEERRSLLSRMFRRRRAAKESAGELPAGPHPSPAE